MRCTAQHLVPLAAVFRVHPFGSPFADHDPLDIRERVSVVGQELQQIGCADMVAPAGGSAPGIFGGAGLCTTEHCSSPEGVMGGERILRPRNLAQLPTLAVLNNFDFQAIAKSGWADIGFSGHQDIVSSVNV